MDCDYVANVDDCIARYVTAESEYGEGLLDILYNVDSMAIAEGYGGTFGLFSFTLWCTECVVIVAPTRCDQGLESG